MAESLGRAVLELTANIAPLSAKLKEGEAAANSMAKQTATGFRGGIAKAAIPAGLAVAGVAIALHKSFDAAQLNQVAEAKLAAAYKASGLNLDKYKGSLDDAEQSSAQLGFKSEDVKASLAKLVVATGSNEKSLKLLGTAQDLARFKGISLTDASTILTSAMAGSSRAARQLGIAVTTSKDASNKASLAYAAEKRAIDAQFPSTAKMTAGQKKQKQALLDALQTKFVSIKADAALTDKQNTAAGVIDKVNHKLGGQADAFSKTAQGAKEKMGAEFQLLEINIGNVLIPVITKLSEELASASEWMTKHATVAKILLAVIGFLGATILIAAAAAKAWAAIQYVASAATTIWTAATEGLNAAMEMNPIGAVVLLIIGLIVVIVEVVKHFDTFKAAAVTAFDKVKSVATSAINWVKSNWPLILGILTGPFGLFIAAFSTNAFGIRDKITSVFGKIIDWFRNTWSDVSGLVSGVFTSIKKAASNGFGIPDDITGAFVSAKHWFSNVWGDVEGLVKGPFSSAWSYISGIPGKITKAFTGLKGDLVSIFSGIGSAIATALAAPINAIIDAIDGIELPTSIHIKTWHGVPDGFTVGYSHPFHIPHLADGGIVSRPTVALIGEAGPEAVVPLGKTGVGGGITVNVSGVVGNERDVAVKIGRELQQLKNRGLDFGLA